MPFDAAFWKEFLSQAGTEIATWVPALGGALFLLGLGWVVARLSQALVGGLSRRLGVDRLAETAGVQGLLDSLPHKTSVSSLLARLVFFVVLLVFVMAAAESLGLSDVSEVFGQLVAYLPSVIAAALILLVGALLARVAGDAVGAISARQGIDGGRRVGTAVRNVLLVVVAILGLERLGVDTAVLLALGLSLVTAVGLTLALAFGLGNRELARNIMAGLHAKDCFEPEQRLRVGDHEGRLLEIGPVKSLLDTSGGRLSIPNQVLVEEEVLILDPSVASIDERGSDAEASPSD